MGRIEKSMVAVVNTLATAFVTPFFIGAYILTGGGTFIKLYQEHKAKTTSLLE